jgi:hypothetical protein
MDLPESSALLLERHARARARAAKAKAEIESLETELCALMGGEPEAFLAGKLVCTNYWSTSKEILDQEALKVEEPEIYRRFHNKWTTSNQVFHVLVRKSGSARAARTRHGKPPKGSPCVRQRPKPASV